jgi:hypothetical protein
MRIQPPKNWKSWPEELDFDKFKEYILSHHVIDQGIEIPILDFYHSIRENYDAKFKCVEDIIMMFPYEYQEPVKHIFIKYIKDK